MKLAWKQIIIAFILGGLAGTAAASIVIPRALHHAWESGRFQERLLNQFSRKLHLTPEQRERVAAILEAKRQKINALRAEVRPKFDEIRATTSGEIRALLTPEQQPKFDEMQAKRDARLKQWRGSGMKP